MSFRFTTAGESHGPELVAVIEGVPAGLTLSRQDIDRDLARRQLGHGRGGRMKIESDRAIISSGVRHGNTLGTPIAVRIENADWQNWKDVMGVARPEGGGEVEPVTVPRPGHADLSGSQKFDSGDIRNILERASARETAARVAAGAVARRLLSEFDVSIRSHVVMIGGVTARENPNLDVDVFATVDDSPVRCLDEEAAEKMVKAIDEAAEAGESLGGIFEVVAIGLVPGLGSFASGPERLGGRIGGALMGIPAIKAAEIGAGASLAAIPGSEAHDEIFFEAGRGYFRRTNQAGGLEGGMTTGEHLVARAAMKPIPTLTKPLGSVDMSNGRETQAFKERSDVCAVPAAAVVAEAVVAAVLAAAMQEKLGGDCLDDMKHAHAAYLERLRRRWPS